MRLGKVDTETIKGCCDLYLAPDHTPKLKTERYDLIIQRFRARSLYLLGLSDVEFTKEYITLLPQNLPHTRLPHGQLVEILLRAEFGDAISETLMSLPSAEIKKARDKQTRHEKHITASTNAHTARETNTQSWPQVIPKDVVYGCLNAYYKGSQWMMPPVCSVCSRQEGG